MIATLFFDHDRGLLRLTVTFQPLSGALRCPNAPNGLQCPAATGILESQEPEKHPKRVSPS